jgi:hypothetical protein
MSTGTPGVKTDAKSKSDGMMPTIVTALLSIVIVLPTIDRSPPNRRCQSPCVNSAAAGPLA